MEFELVERPISEERAGDARIQRQRFTIFRWRDEEADEIEDDEPEDDDRALHIPEEEDYEPEI